MQDERLLWLKWVLTPGLGIRRCHQLLNLIDAPESLFTHPEKWPLPPALKQRLREIHHLGEQHPVHREACAQLDWARQQGHHLVSFRCDVYPPLLSHTEEAPLMLWVHGDPNLLSLPQVGMVGSRNATLSARRTAEDLAADITRTGLVVTSGGAAGIDSCAHQGALGEGGHTVAVLGCGVDVAYPKANRSLFQSITGNGGALVSEYPLGTQPKAGHFPRRNRIISGMSQAVIVVEAAERSGSLITAQHAMEQGRDVYALPGDVNNPNSRGCHQLIQQGAYLLTEARDLLPSLQPGYDLPDRKPLEPDMSNMPETQRQLLSLLSLDPQPLDVLSDQLDCASHQLLEPLLELELAGWIEHQPGGYARVSNA
ncbi:MAG: DNA-processing protein DprA [Saccharospirillum sp.]